MAEDKKCEATVHGYPAHQCSRRAVIERRGKWYCKQHDPEPMWVARKKEFERNEARADLRVFQTMRRELVEKMVDYFLRMDIPPAELASVREGIEDIDKKIADILPKTR